MNFFYPDYNKNIINVSASFANFLGNKTDVRTLPALDSELAKNYENVVFIIFDGMGSFALRKNLKRGDFLRKHKVLDLTTVFPSTTTNATTTLMTCKYPSEHKFLGWSLNFEELGRAADIYRNAYSDNRLELATKDYMFQKHPFLAYYDESLVDTDFEIHTVFPEYVLHGKSKKNRIASSVDDVFSEINAILSESSDKKFIYSYCEMPDHSMHTAGPFCKEVKKITENISAGLEILHKTHPSKLFVITADHGQVQIKGYDEIYKDKDLLDLTSRQVSLESRAASFCIKEGKTEEFVKYFKAKYGKHYKLLKVDELISRGVFGPEDVAAKKYLGDFIAVSKGNRMFVFYEHSDRFKGHHSSLTREMKIPLIMIGKP